MTPKQAVAFVKDNGAQAVDSLLAIHQAQLLSYLKHSGKRLGLLINFNSILLKDGIRRVICG